MSLGKLAYHETEMSYQYVGSLLTNQNSIHDKIKCKIKAENSLYYSLQMLSNSH